MPRQHRVMQAAATCLMPASSCSTTSAAGSDTLPGGAHLGGRSTGGAGHPRPHTPPVCLPPPAQAVPSAAAPAGSRRRTDQLIVDPEICRRLQHVMAATGHRSDGRPCTPLPQQDPRRPALLHPLRWGCTQAACPQQPCTAPKGCAPGRHVPRGGAAMLVQPGAASLRRQVPQVSKRSLMSRQTAACVQSEAI
jgi:hypothetical protein